MNALKYWSGYVFSALRARLYGLRPGKRAFVRNDRVRNSPLYDDVCAWQKAQMESMTFENDRPTKEVKGTVDLPLMRRIHRRTLLEIRHELGDLWRPSSVTMNEGRGISLDQSIAIMHRLRDAGFPDDSLGVVSVEFAGRRHSFAIVQDRADDFWMLDNGKFSYCPVRGSVFLSVRKDVHVLIGFNFFDVWNY
ncbi:hypothetical protein [Desulfomicrobium baculatum]|uniref:Uncharacterized protein n=1 Tax=Desulfomicrobium baculatum (strain DSM 4028 / VKM B-1378 / X) TaxID=525897 RepID=C7LNE4_DESBD|nr:hypothetical protein [Desulfomicrobium baculatum]ACU90113.1 hypothetical protein Dbac_2027 [Desulfomicrobium baculatum DSM 4028]